MMKLLLVPALLFTLSGCGDLFKTPVKEKELDTSRLKAACELELDQFAHLLNRNIGSQIECLRSNLNLFIQLVKTDRPGTMSRTAFEAYLTLHRPDISPDTIKAIRSVFQINHLITGDDREYIAKASMDRILDFVKLFNEEMALNFSPIFRSDAPSSFNWHKHQRIKVLQLAGYISGAFNGVFNKDRGGEIHKINIDELLESFSTDATREDIERFKKVLFVKKMLIGGNGTELTHVEVQRFIFNFPSFAAIAYDIMRYDLIDPPSQENFLTLLESNVDQLRSIVLRNGGREQEKFFTLKELIDAVDILAPGKYPLEKYSQLIKFAKKLVMGGPEDAVYGADFGELMTKAKQVLVSGRAFHHMFRHFRAQMDSPNQVVINFDANRHLFPQHQEEFRTFVRIVKDYRFMKGNRKAPIFNFAWTRNPEGVFEAYLLEYALDMVFKKYGTPGTPQNPNAPTTYSGLFTHYMRTSQLKALLDELEKDLVAMGLLYPKRTASIADTVSLLGTLFQNQSSMVHEKEPVLDVNEAAEFATTMIASTSMANQIRKNLSAICSEDQFERIEPVCFRQNFMKELCKGYREHFPLLFFSLDIKHCDAIDSYNEELLTYQNYSILAAKSCPFYLDANGNQTDEEIYFSSGDIMSIITAMMHVEATILRWDVNRNNQMDAGEVRESYRIYSPALDGFLENKPSYVRIFKEQIFLYMIKYEEIPDESNFGSIFKFVRFLTSSGQRVPARRRTFASVLVNIGKENEKARRKKGEKPFPCNNLRDPDNWPEDDE